MQVAKLTKVALVKRAGHPHTVEVALTSNQTVASITRDAVSKLQLAPRARQVFLRLERSDVLLPETTPIEGVIADPCQAGVHPRFVLEAIGPNARHTGSCSFSRRLKTRATVNAHVSSCGVMQKKALLLW